MLVTIVEQIFFENLKIFSEMKITTNGRVMVERMGSL